MKTIIRFSLALALLAACGLFNVAGAQTEGSGPPEIIKHKINPHSLGGAVTTGGTGVVTPAITFHGGPVIASATAYVIWYGNWNQSNGSDTAAGQQIVRDFLNNIGGSPHFNLNTTYSTPSFIITGNVSFGGETTDAYSRGSRLKDNDILTIVNNSINSGKLPYNANGVYFVLTSSDVSEVSGFCTKYCGWHTAATPSAGHVRYSFVGNANRCLNACAIQTVGPNGNAGVDAMLSVIAHELEEAVTDPDLNAWYDSGGAENADKCAWTFGHFQYQVSNGAWANIHLGARDFLIQRNLEHNTSGDLCKVDATHN